MREIPCPQCHTRISDEALSCPHCHYVGKDPKMAISKQDHEIVPKIRIEMVKWGNDETQPLFLTPRANSVLLDHFTNWEWWNAIPGGAEFIRQLLNIGSEDAEEELVAKVPAGIKKLIQEGRLRFQMDKQGEILPNLVDDENRIKCKVRLEPKQFTQNLGLDLVQLQTQMAIANVLDKVNQVQNQVRRIERGLQGDRLAKLDAAWNLMQQALAMDDARQRDMQIQNARAEANEAKSILANNYQGRRQSLDDKGDSDRSQNAADALQCIVGVVNAARIIDLSYAMYGELDSQILNLHSLRDFVTECKLDDREELLEINSCLASNNKQPRLVNEITGLARQIVAMDNRVCECGAISMAAENSRELENSLRTMDIGKALVLSDGFAEELAQMGKVESAGKHEHCFRCGAELPARMQGWMLQCEACYESFQKFGKYLLGIGVVGLSFAVGGALEASNRDSEGTADEDSENADEEEGGEP